MIYFTPDTLYRNMVALAEIDWMQALRDGYKFLLPRHYSRREVEPIISNIITEHNHRVSEYMKSLINANSGNTNDDLYHCAYQHSHSEGWLAVYYTICDYLDEIEAGATVDDILNKMGY